MNNWFFAAGDLGFIWGEQIAAFSWLPRVFHGDIGFGFNGLLSLWLDYPFRLFIKLLSGVGISWFISEKLLWLFVFAIAVYSSYKLVRHWTGSVMYSANTYFLLLFTGGQLGVALAYAYAPFVFYRFMKHQKPNVKEQVINGLCLALLVTFDLRIAFLVVIATVFWWSRSMLSLIVAGTIHIFWILPTLLASHGTAGLGSEFTNPGMLKFLSFTDFSHALALLHPNWPENLFGKVYFLQPEFLVIPIIAFGALLFTKEKTVRFFALLALIGAFFAKGVNDPSGGLFQWMFVHVPGFVMFRDPTKFYLYIAISYAVLTPVIIKKNKYFGIIFIIFWIFTLRGVIVNPVQTPQEYVVFKNVLISDGVPSRTLWIPAKENFAYYSDTHPILTATDSSIIDPSVKYVVVPIDVSKRIFLNDYKYDAALRSTIIESIPFPRDQRFHDLAVFENPGFTGMHVTVPAEAVRQQQLANIGAGISAVFLLFWLLWIYLH